MLELYGFFCLFLGFGFESHTQRHSCQNFPPLGNIYSLGFLHLCNCVIKTVPLYSRNCTSEGLNHILGGNSQPWIVLTGQNIFNLGVFGQTVSGLQLSSDAF